MNYMRKRKLFTVMTFAAIAPLSLICIASAIVLYPTISTPQDIARQPSLSNLFRAFQKGGGEVQGAATVDNARIPILQKFFTKYNSPLVDYVSYIVQTADKYGIDYRLIPAISMQESTGCKFIPENSYNCWGWGIYGDKVTRFPNYPEAIETVSRGLKNNYIDKGLTSPEEIMKRYTPPSKGSWAEGVHFFFEQLQ